MFLWAEEQNGPGAVKPDAHTMEAYRMLAGPTAAAEASRAATKRLVQLRFQPRHAVISDHTERLKGASS